MKISVIIPFYNEEKYLEGCLKSLSEQSFKDFEVIIVNDGSEKISNIKYQISNIRKKFRNFKFLTQSHQGPGPARNLGARYAKGKILVFVDSDMIFDKDFFKNLIKPIVKGRAKGTFSKEEYVANWENPWARCWSFNQGVGKRLIPKNYPNQAPVFRAILKDVFNRVGGFTNGGYTDDWTLSEKLGFKARLAAGAIYFHYNPASLKEIWQQARWIGKRKRKFGFMGRIANIIRRLLPFSLISACLLTLKNKEPRCLIFKIIYDFAEALGCFEALIGLSLAR